MYNIIITGYLFQNAWKRPAKNEVPDLKNSGA